MPTPRNPRRTLSADLFEEHVTATLEAQDRVLEKQDEVLQRLDKKLGSPALNGGFDDLVERVARIDSVIEKLRDSQESTSQKVAEIHTVVMDPETGLYHKVKANSMWIENAGRGLKWFGGLFIAGTLTGIGKLLYDFITGHIHVTP